MVTEGIVSDDWRCPRLSRVVHNVNTARKCDKFTDVTFVVGPDENACTIKAHRVVLGTANDELAKLVSGFNNLERIKIPDVSPRGFKNLIRFLYDIDVKFSDFSTVRETHLVAQKYKVHKLKRATEYYLNQAVSYESALKVLQIAIEFEMPGLQMKCIDIISIKYQSILKSEELISAPFEVMSAVLSVRPCQGEDCQYQMLLAIGKWKKKHEADQSHLECLLTCVDFTLIRMADFNAFIDENEGLLSDVDIGAFQKYIQSNKIDDAPKWYRSFDHDFDQKNDNAKTEAPETDTSEKKFSLDITQQKLKVEEALAKEMSKVDEVLREEADNACERLKTTINETVQLIRDYVCDIIKEAVETAVENFEDDLNYNLKMEEKNGKNLTNGEKESINASTKIAPKSETIDKLIANLSVNESCNVEGSDVVPKSADSTEDYGEKESINASTKIAPKSVKDKLIFNLSVKESCNVEGSDVVPKSEYSIEDYEHILAISF